MDRRKFIKLTGMSILATAASQILAACGGGGGGGTEEPVVQWTEFTVTETGQVTNRTFKVEIEYYHYHNMSVVTGSGTTYAGDALTYMSSNQIDIAGTGGHPHYFQLSAGEATTLSTNGGTVTVVANNAGGLSDHTHNVRITRTA